MCSINEVAAVTAGDTAFAVVRRGLDALAGESLDEADGEALRSSLGRLQRLVNRIEAEKLRRIAAIDDRQTLGDNARTTADVVADQLRLSRGEAKAATSSALVLEQLPETARRFAAGQVGVAQVGEAARSLDQLEQARRHGVRVPGDAAARLDALVAERGGEQDRRQLRQALEEWAARLSPRSLKQRDGSAFARRKAWTTRGADGMTRFHAQLDAAGAAHLQAALGSLSRPTGREDQRTVGQRCADALVELARRALDGGDLPETATQRPHVLLLTNGDALHERPGADPSLLDGVGPVSTATAAQLCCDADVTAVITDRDGTPIDARRLAPRPTRRQRAVVVGRDRHCVGCGAAATRCEIHHVRWRRRGGETVVDNLVLVCWSCHAHIHHHGWTVVRQGDGRFALERRRADDGGWMRHAA